MNRLLPMAGIAVAAFAGGFAASCLLVPAPVREVTDAGVVSTGAAAVVRTEEQRVSLSSASGASFSRQSALDTDGSLAAEFAKASEISNFSRKYSRMAILCEQIDGSNGREMVDVFLAKSSQSERILGLSMIFGAWAASDPKAAIAYARGLTERNLRSNAVQSVLSSWASSDYAAARAYVDEYFTQGSLRNNALRAVFQPLAEKDPQLAIREGLKLGREGSGIIQSAIWRVARDNPEAATEMVANIPMRNLRESAIQSIASVWSEKDREATLAWVESLDGSVKYSALASVLTNWSRESPEDACKWIAARPDIPKRNDLLRQMASFTSEQDPLKAMDFIELMTSKSQQDNMIENLAQTWNQQDPDMVRKWAEAQTDASIRARIWSGIISSTAQDDPASAISFLEHLPESERSNSIRDIAYRWGQDNPASALDWAADLPDASTRQNVMGNVLANWIGRNPAASLDWFSRMPVGEERDALISRFDNSLLRENPQAAVQLTSSISDPAMRQRELESLARYWMREDPAAARIWVVGQSGLPAESQQRLLQSNQD